MVLRPVRDSYNNLNLSVMLVGLVIIAATFGLVGMIIVNSERDE